MTPGAGTTDEWEQLQPKKPGRRREEGVQVGMYQYGRALPRLQLTFDEATARRIGDPAKDSFVVLLGRSAAQRPYLQLRKVQPAENVTRPFRMTRFHAGRNGPSRVWRLLLDRHARFPLVEIKAADVDFRVERGAMVVTLPSWAWDKEAKERAETARQRVLTGRQS